MVSARIPIACKLDAAEARYQLGRWRRLRRHLLRTEWTATGVVLWFQADAEDAVREVAGVEQECCAFLILTATLVDGEVRLELGSDDPNGVGVIELLVDNAGGASATT